MSQHSELLEKNDIKIKEYSETEAGMARLNELYGTVPPCGGASKDGYAQLKSGCSVLTKTRTTLDKARLAKTKIHRDIVGAINGVAKDLSEQIQVLELPYKEAKKTIDEREKREKEVRIARLQVKVDELTNWHTRAYGKTSHEMEDIRDALLSIDTSMDYYDLTQQAADAQANAAKYIDGMISQQQAKEAMAEQQADLDRRQADLDAQAEEQRDTSTQNQKAMLKAPSRVQDTAESFAGVDTVTGETQLPMMDDMDEEPTDAAAATLSNLAGIPMSKAYMVVGLIEAGKIPHLSLMI